jgi:hypothetical protein
MGESEEYLFSTMLTGPRRNADEVVYFHLQRRKICTVLYNNILYSGQYLCVGSLNVKKSLTLGGGRCEPYPVLKKLTAPFLTSH